MAVSGLAEGFLAGFNTMDNYQRGQKADERAEREMSLRDAMFKQNTANSNRDFSLRQADFDNQVAQQKVTNDQWGKEHDLRLRDLKLRQQGEQGLAAIRQQTLAHNDYIFNRDKKDREDSDWFKQNAATFDLAYQARLNGQADPAEYTELLNDKRLQKGGTFYQFNFDRYGDGQHLKAAQQVVPQISGLMSDLNSGKLSWDTEDGQQAIVQRLNAPEVIGPLNVILEQEVKRGIGEVDFNSGKKITNKELTHVIPTPDGQGLMYGLKVTYADGTSADSVVTEGRNTRPGDPVKVTQWGDAIKTVYQRANMFHQLNGAGQNQETLKRVGQNLGFTSAPDEKGWRTARVNYANETQKGVAQILASGDPNTKAFADDYAASREKGTSEIDRIYGVGGDKPQTASPLELWASDDGRRGFAQEAARRGDRLPRIRILRRWNRCTRVGYARAGI
ncbi:hypothetical protein FKF78_18410 [Aeromonas hydrophila]|nr:hypothetical protein [Aeromonas hydrophila]